MGRQMLNRIITAVWARLAQWLYPYVILALLAGGAHGAQPTVADAMPQLNAIRARRGLPPFVSSPTLLARAKYEAAIRAQRSVTGHLGHDCSPGHEEGVGWDSRTDHWGVRFHSCFYLERGQRKAGAAVAVAPNGQSYYELIIW